MMKYVSQSVCAEEVVCAIEKHWKILS